MIMLSVSLSLCGLFPPYFEIIYTAIFLTCIPLGLINSLTTPILGIYVIAGVWITRSWIIPAGLLLLITELILILTSPYPGLQSLGAALGSSATIATGLVIRSLQRKAQKAIMQAEVSQKEALQASYIVRKQLAAQLHDTIAKDLAQIAVLAQQLSNQGSANKYELDSLVQLATASSKRIKPIILQLDSEYERTSIAQTVSLATKMLSTRSITLVSDIEAHVDSIVNRQQALLVSLVIREACTNILKYGKSGTTASLEVIRDTDGTIDISISNLIGEHHSDSGITGGFGLANLDSQLQANHGTLTYEHNKTRWILSATIPN